MSQNSDSNSKSSLLLHSCCAPCSTSVIEQINKDFDLTLFWYNPNIEPKDEHDKRLDTLKKYLNDPKNDFDIIALNNYEEENRLWHEFISGYENEPEGGKRCDKCFEFRLARLNECAKKNNFDKITTTLSVSPYKDSKKINQIGSELSKMFLEEDFKKSDGYRRSIELSKEFDLYRQNYCGCIYSKQDRL
jgi:hypothetical protein